MRGVMTRDARGDRRAIIAATREEAKTLDVEIPPAARGGGRDRVELTAAAYVRPSAAG